MKQSFQNAKLMTFITFGSCDKTCFKIEENLVNLNWFRLIQWVALIFLN